MRTLKDHLILYDAECPMCNLYTGAFVKSKMLDSDGRAAYQKAYSTCSQIDLQRAVNEIALVNRQTGEVTYGINSLFAIISHAFPLFRPLFNSRLFAGAMRSLYAFISYNRRVIIPASEKEHGFAVQPSFHKKYRIAYLLVTWLFTSLIFYCYRNTTGLYSGYTTLGNRLMMRIIITSGRYYFGCKEGIALELPGKHDDRSCCRCLVITACFVAEAGWLTFF